MSSVFLDEQRLLVGPWQAFERDIARLLMHSGFADVRIVGGSGDHGADVLGVKNRGLWVFQCKFTGASSAPPDAIAEVVRAGRDYGADQLAIAVSRPPSDAFNSERSRYERDGLRLLVFGPAELLRWSAEATEYPASRRALRPYQEDASTRMREALLDTGRAQMVMATGLGKTVVMAELVSDLLRDGLVPFNRALVVAHTLEIVRQLHANFWFQLPKWVATHQIAAGERPTYWEGITFATVQSLRSRSGDLPEIGLMLVDEAHHIGATGFAELIDEVRPPLLGGVTATPWRGDEQDLDDILGPAVFTMDIAEGLRRGFLSDVDYRLMADNLDWAFVQEASRYRYSLRQLNTKLIIPTRDEEAARVIREVFEKDGRRHGVVFCRSIEHAEYFASVLRHRGLRAEPIASHLNSREREVLMSRFKQGYLDMLVTVDLFNEGVDLPDVDLVVFMRVTHSRRIFVQQLGRGLRTSPGKDRVVVLDFVSDLRRVAEVVELDRAVRGGHQERLGLGEQLVAFNDASAGGFIKEWMLDQASVALREGDPHLEVPRFNFPEPLGPGAVE